MKTIKQIETAIAAQIKKNTRAIVEVTNRGEDKWTVSGDADAVQTAVQFLYSHNLMTMESSVYDEEVGESFAYLRS